MTELDIDAIRDRAGEGDVLADTYALCDEIGRLRWECEQERAEADAANAQTARLVRDLAATQSIVRIREAALRRAGVDVAESIPAAEAADRLTQENAELRRRLEQAERGLQRWCEWQDQVLNTVGSETLDQIEGLESTAPPCRHEGERDRARADRDATDGQAIGLAEQLDEMRAERARARAAAVALRQENAELRQALERITRRDDATDEELDFPLPDGVQPGGTDSVEIAAFALARVDPAGADR